MRGFRGKVAAAIPSQTMRRRFWESTLDGPIAEAALAGDEAAASARLAAEIDRWAAERPAPQGEVYLVGAGPGDPDLVTFRALRLMQKADVVLYDRLADERIMTLVRREAERIYVGKRPDDHELPQEEISALLVRLAREGKRVLRLKGGDPFLFGRGGEEIETLAAHGVPFQVCPGVTAAVGASAYAGIPLTHRDHAQACVFVTGHGKDGAIDLDWAALIKPRQTVAVYMGLRNLEPLTEAFIAHGADPDLPAAIVDNATRPNQRVVVATLGTLATAGRAAELKGPSIVIVGSVVSFARNSTGTRPPPRTAKRPRDDRPAARRREVRAVPRPRVGPKLALLSSQAFEGEVPATAFFDNLAPGNPRTACPEGRESAVMTSTTETTEIKPSGPHWIRAALVDNLPYVVIIVLGLVGISWTSFTVTPTASYWLVVTPVLALICIVAGWTHTASGERLEMVVTQALQWAAVLIAMYLLTVSDVQRSLNVNAIALMILTLLALGVFVSGLNMKAWRLCVTGAFLAVSVPTIAWLQDAALFLLILAVVLILLMLGIWWVRDRNRVDV